nr:hypothetical protein Iba_chr02cCG11200 [Ipomoea batatas]
MTGYQEDSPASASPPLVILSPSSFVYIVSCSPCNQVFGYGSPSPVVAKRGSAGIRDLDFERFEGWFERSKGSKGREFSEAFER